MIKNKIRQNFQILFTNLKKIEKVLEKLENIIQLEEQMVNTEKFCLSVKVGNLLPAF